MECRGRHPGAVRGKAGSHGRRDGTRLPRPSHRLGPRARGEEPASGILRHGEAQGGLRPRGGGLGGPRPAPAHRELLLRPHPRGSPPRIRGVHGRWEPEGLDQVAEALQRRTSGGTRTDPGRRHPVRMGPALRAREGRRPPGREAGQRADDIGRDCEGLRLRSREGPIAGGEGERGGCRDPGTPGETDRRAARHASGDLRRDDAGILLAGAGAEGEAHATHGSVVLGGERTSDVHGWCELVVGGGGARRAGVLPRDRTGRGQVAAHARGGGWTARALLPG